MWRIVSYIPLLTIITVLARTTIYLPSSSVQAVTISDAYKGYKGAKKLLKDVDAGVDVYNACRAAGGSELACGGKVTLCYLYRRTASKFTKGLWNSGYTEALYKSMCLGEPTLKCCYRENDQQCHSAFNEPAPINCEGNPYYGPTSTAGLCRRPCPTCAGCLCDYIPKCAGPGRFNNNGGNIFGNFDAPEFHIGRMDNFVGAVGSFFRNDFNNDGSGGGNNIFPSPPNGAQPLPNITILDEVMDFVRYRGCQSFVHNFEIISDAIPILTPVNYRGDNVSRPNDLMDQIPAVQSMLPYYAVARFVVDIPHFWLKVDYINANQFNTSQINSALSQAGITDPTQVMLSWIDYGGLLILDHIFEGETWKLLTVPVNLTYYNITEAVEIPNLRSCSINNGRASPVNITNFNVSLNGTVCTVKLTLPKAQGRILVRTQWGDRSNMNEPTLDTGKTGSLTLKYTYPTCGLKRISIQLTNEARLRTLLLKTVNLPCNPQLPSKQQSLVAYPNVANIFIQVTISRIFNPYGDPGRQFFLFEGASTTPGTTQNYTLTDANATFVQKMGTHLSVGDLPQIANLTFPWDSSPLRYIRFTCRTIDHYLYSAAAATINKVHIEMMNGEIVDLKFNSSSSQPILCARRGNLFEDTQQIGILTLLQASRGKVVPPIQSTSSSSSIGQYFKNDGYYYEQYPNRFTYSRVLIK